MKVVKKLRLLFCFVGCLSCCTSVAKIDWTQFALTLDDITILKDFVGALGKEIADALKIGVEGKTYTLGQLKNDLPVVDKLTLPKFMNKWLDVVKIKQPTFTESIIDGATAYEIKWDNAVILGQERTGFVFRLYAGPGLEKYKGPGRAGQQESGVSFGVGIPGTWTLNDLAPEIKERLLKIEEKLLPEKLRNVLKKLHISVDDFAKIVDWLQFENLVYVLSFGEYTDPVWGKLFTGGNIGFTIKLDGPLKRLTDYFGEELTKAQFRGVVGFLLSGSEARAILPGRITLLRWPVGKSKPAKFQLRAGDVQFRVGITPSYLPTVKAIGSYEFLFPGQKEFVKLYGSVDYMGIKGDISLYSQGMIENIFGIPGVDVGNLGVVLTLIPAEEPIGGFGMTSEIHLGKLQMSGLFRADITGDLALIGSYLGGLNERDLIDLVLHFVKTGAEIGRVDADVNQLKPMLYQAMPRMNIGDFQLYVVPKALEVFDRRYSTGIYLRFSGNFFGLGGQFEGKLSYSGLKLEGKVDPVRIPKRKPAFILTGAGTDRVRGNADDGAIVQAELSIAKQEFFMDGLVEIPPLGIKDEVTMRLVPSVGVSAPLIVVGGFLVFIGDLEFSTKKKFAGLFETDLSFRIRQPGTISDLTATDKFSLDDIFVEGSFSQGALDKLGQLLTVEADKLNEKAQQDLQAAQEKLNVAKQNVKNWEQKAKANVDAWVEKEAEKLQKKIDGLKAKIKASRDRCAAAPRGKGRKVKACAEEVLAPGRKARIKALERRRDIGLKKIVAGAAKTGVKFVSGAAKAGLNTAKLGVKTAQGSVDAANKLSNFAGKFSRSVFNIKSVKIDRSSLDQVVKDKKFSKVTVKGTIFGRPFCQVYQVDLKKPEQFVQQIFAGLVQVFGPKASGKAISDLCKS